MVKLIALVDTNLDGVRKIKKGERYEVRESVARLLVGSHRARIDEDEPKKTGRVYKRRDMRAED